MLLLYFAGFAVAPVSAVLPSEQAHHIGSKQDTLEKRTDKTAVFFYDLALWEALKKVKRSDDSKNNIIWEKQSDNAPNKSCAKISLNAIRIGNVVSIPILGISAYCNIGVSAVQRYTHYYHSGLAPPFLA